MQEAKRTDGMVHTNIIKTGQGQAAAAQATTTVTVQQQPAPAYPQQPAAVAYPQQQQFQQQQFQQQAPYDPNMAAAYAVPPAGYAAPQPAGYPGAPPAYAPQVRSHHYDARADIKSCPFTPLLYQVFLLRKS